MRERVWTFVLVGVVTLTIWLFAEAESLGSFSGAARVQFASPPNADRLVRAPGFGGSVEIEVRGPRGDISRARDVLGGGLRLSPDGAGIGASEGKQTVNLFEVLRRHKPLTDTGVEIVSVRPDKVDVDVTVLETLLLPIVATVPSTVAEVVGEPRVTPETARVKVPRGVVPAGGGDGYRVVARPTPEQLRRLPPTGSAPIQNVPLELPEALALVPDVQLLDRTASVELTIRNRNATREVPLVPVQVLMPPFEVERWNVRLNPDDEFTSVTLTGPADTLDAIINGSDRAVAVLALSSDDLESAITSKDINIILIRGGVPMPLPNTVQATPAKPSVRFEVVPVEAIPWAVSGGAGDTGALCRAVAERARDAARRLRTVPGSERAHHLHQMASSLRRSTGEIRTANAQDLARATGLSGAMRDRLFLDDARVGAMADAVDAIADQPDPVGRVIEQRVLASGIRLEKRRVPIGVILIVYESRPNVTSDAAALCFKSGNAAVLRGGSEAIASNRAIVSALRRALEPAGLDGAIGFVDTPDRDAVAQLVRLQGLIDLAIPRGGPGLMRAVTEAARIPVIKHDAGNCHVYADAHLDGMLERAVEIVVNAKAQRPGVCNAAETLLVHRSVADEFVPRVCVALAEAGVEIRGDDTTRRLFPGAKPATEDDWRTEYLALIIAVRVVESLEDACDHIRRYGSQHTEAILTSSDESARRFVALVDSASVMVNCSTRFADGGEYGLGAEIGISTDRLHARGPMGAEDLTTFQWLLTGSGQIKR